MHPGAIVRDSSSKALQALCRLARENGPPHTVAQQRPSNIQRWYRTQGRRTRRAEWRATPWRWRESGRQQVPPPWGVASGGHGASPR
eukprot:6046985-Pyramimonas_sp.AAC.1